MKCEGLSKNSVFAIGLALNMVVGGVDFFTGLDIGLTVFYLLPIAFVTWFAGRKAGLLMSVVSIITTVLSDILDGKILIHIAIETWNALVHLGFFIVVTYLLGRLKHELDGRSKIIAELKKALNEIKTLSGLLPMCAWCKKVRDDSGYWKQVEQYIAEHTEAEFTHGICPDCLKKMEPELYEKIIGKAEKPGGGKET
ncbi:MAG: hypothetical protein M0Z60_13615 [Nitrospiraceae bacterium]|nr:hypothetical protein [Nitrospiraceae bacterium]